MCMLCGGKGNAPPGAGVDWACSTKVAELDLAVAAFEAVLWLNVAVHVAGVVHMLHAIHDLDARAQHLVLGLAQRLTACRQDTFRHNLSTSCTCLLSRA